MANKNQKPLDIPCQFVVMFDIAAPGTVGHPHTGDNPAVVEGQYDEGAPSL